MGYTFSPSGELLKSSGRCRTCEELIHDCGNERLESLWEVASIDRNRHLLIAGYFSMLPVLVLCITSTVQAVVCSKQPDRRRLHLPGNWQGEPYANALITLQTTLSSDRRGVGGTYRLSTLSDQGDDHCDMAIQESRFRFRYLYFSVSQDGSRQGYRMALADSSTQATLDKLSKDNRYVFVCGLKRSQKTGGSRQSMSAIP